MLYFAKYNWGLFFSIATPLLLAGATLLGFRVFAHRPVEAALLASPPPFLILSQAPRDKIIGKKGDIVVGRLTAKNSSDESVTILGASSNCSCTLLTSHLPVTLAPGAEIGLEFNMKIGAPNGDGKFSKSIQVFVDKGGYVPPQPLQVGIKS